MLILLFCKTTGAIQVQPSTYDKEPETHDDQDAKRALLY